MKLDDDDRIRLLQPPVGVVRAVLDTDTYNEIDDQFALVQSLLSPERIALEAIYAAPFHNSRSSGPGAGMDLSYDEIIRLLDRMDRKANGFVYRGVREYVGEAKSDRSAEAVDDLIDRARAGSPDRPMYVIAIAAISNIASRADNCLSDCLSAAQCARRGPETASLYLTPSPPFHQEGVCVLGGCFRYGCGHPEP